MPEQDEHRGQMKHRQEVVGVPLPSDDESTVVMEPREEPFDFPPALRAPYGSAVLRRDLSVRAMPGDHLDAHRFREQRIERIAVEGLVADQPVRPPRQKSVVERRLHQLYFRRRSAGHVDGDRKTMAVADRHDLGAFSTLGRTDFGAPFFAAPKLPSMCDTP